MATETEVNDFLQAFKVNFDLKRVIFRDDCSKNSQVLLDFEIGASFRDKILLELGWKDYYQGPVADTLNPSYVTWIFKKIIKGQEIDIKITLGFAGTSFTSISFHC